MKCFDAKTVEYLRQHYPRGTRIKLIKMNDQYDTMLRPGYEGTVAAVDDIGTIHIAWDCGSSLGLIYGEDVFQKAE